MGEPARDNQSHAEPRSHRDVLAHWQADENDNDCLFMERAVHKVASHRTGGDHSMGMFDLKSSAMEPLV